MIRPMFGHRPKPRKFDMPTRYYDPKKEERKHKRIRIKTNGRRRDRAQNTRILLYAAGLGIVIYIMAVL